MILINKFCYLFSGYRCIMNGHEINFKLNFNLLLLSVDPFKNLIYWAILILTNKNYIKSYNSVSRLSIQRLQIKLLKLFIELEMIVFRNYKGATIIYETIVNKSIFNCS